METIMVITTTVESMEKATEMEIESDSVENINIVLNHLCDCEIRTTYSNIELFYFVCNNPSA